MKARTSAVGAVVLGFLAMASACSNTGGEDERVYSATDIEGFEPESQAFTYQEVSSLSAGEAWEKGWPDPSTADMQPAECLMYLTSSELLLETDESETADDTTVFISGFLADETTNVEGAVYVKARVFSSASSARDMVSGLRSAAVTCANGYSYVFGDFAWTADSVSASDIDLSGAENLIKIEETGVSYNVESEPTQYIDAYTHYIHHQGNVVFIASYAFTGGSVSDADAAELIRQFIAHLG